MIKLNFKLFFVLKVGLFYFIILLNSYAANETKNDSFLVIGSNAASVKIKIFSSLTCPHCASFHMDVVPKIKESYVNSGKVQLIFIDFPLDQAAFNASKLLHCLGQEKKIVFLDTIYEDQDKWASGTEIKNINDNLKKIAENFGINETEFYKCLNDDVVGDKILNARIDGAEKYSIDSTPTIVINEKKFEGSKDFENIRKKIEKLI